MATPSDAKRPMMYRHDVADSQIFDAHIAGQGAHFHAQPRSRTRCGIPFGRFDDPAPLGAARCAACAELDASDGPLASPG